MTEKILGADAAEDVAAGSIAPDAAPHAVRVIELDPSVWMRGQEGQLLRDLDGHRQQCCIGVACTALGVDDSMISGIGSLSDVELSAVPEEFQALAVFESYEEEDTATEGDLYISDDRLGAIYEFNDAADIADSDRVQKINTELERLGASLRFALKAEEGKD